MDNCENDFLQPDKDQFKDQEKEQVISPKSSGYLDQLTNQDQESIKFKMLVAIKTDIRRRERKVVRIKKLKNALSLSMIALSFLLIHVLIWSSFRVQEHVIVTGPNEKLSIELPDRTVVVLNSNSKLTYETSKAFGFDRRVVLDGEGYFEVRKLQNDKKFTINEGTALEVEVYGTMFSFKNKFPVHKLTLVEGSVALGYRSDNGLKKQIVKPGETVRYHALKQSTETTFRGNAINLLSWKEGRMKLEMNTFNEVIEVLNEMYDLPFEYENIQEDTPLVSGHLPLSDDPREVAKNLSVLFKIEVSIQENAIISE